MERASADVFSSEGEASSIIAVYADKKLMQTWIVDMNAAMGDTDKMEEQMKVLQQKLNVPYIGIANHSHLKRDLDSRNYFFYHTSTCVYRVITVVRKS